MSDEHDLDAGDFAAWLRQVRDAIRGTRDAVVPCGECVACCTSSQFVHIGPDERETLARIPAALLFPAPGMPRGHVLLGYDERGHCPMLIEGQCSIYAQRPRTCRSYDCRVFPAADVVDDDATKADIARQARRWQFAHPSAADRAEHEAVRAAAAYLGTHPTILVDAGVPASAIQIAVVAIAIHQHFLGAGSRPDATTVAAAVGTWATKGLRKNSPSRT
ncbi:MAG: YkgJ family cysteine cluster protein [Candidatus Binatia bacterium]